MPREGTPFSSILVLGFALFGHDAGVAEFLFDHLVFDFFQQLGDGLIDGEGAQVTLHPVTE